MGNPIPPPQQGPPGPACPNCRYPINGRPEFCPTCGYRLVPKSPRRLIAAILAVFFCGGPSLLLGICLGGASSYGSQPSGGNLLVLGAMAIFVVFCLYAIYELVAYIRAK